MKVEAFSILKRLASYLAYFVALVIFFYFAVSTGLYFFQDGSLPLSEDGVFGGLILPSLYAYVGLGVALVVEFTLLTRPSSPTEKKIFSWANVAVCLFHLAVLLVVLIVGGTSLKEGHPDFQFLLVPLIPPLLLSAGEISYATAGLISAHKEGTRGKDTQIDGKTAENNAMGPKVDYNDKRKDADGLCRSDEVK